MSKKYYEFSQDVLDASEEQERKDREKERRTTFKLDELEDAVWHAIKDDPKFKDVLNDPDALSKAVELYDPDALSKAVELNDPDALSKAVEHIITEAKRILREQKKLGSNVGDGKHWLTTDDDLRRDGPSGTRPRRDRSRDPKRDAHGRKLYKTRNKKSRRARKTRRARNTRKARR